MIIEAGMAYASVISALHKACFEKPWNEKAITDILGMPGATGLIAHSDEETPQGFMLFRLAADEAEIISIGVAPSVRRSGYGKQLLQASIVHAAQREASRMFLEVAEDNAGAKAFYEKAGFTIAGQRPDYYHSPTGKSDALIYVLEITGK
jgi:[ribosomal protein S18]-alanine N-acetyltransferase